MNARAAIDRAGGLCTVSDLAARWGVSRQAVDLVKDRPGFPAPIRTHGGMALYPALEADAFRASNWRRKPGPKSNQSRKDT